LLMIETLRVQREQAPSKSCKSCKSREEFRKSEKQMRTCGEALQLIPISSPPTHRATFPETNGFGMHGDTVPR
jgi:hypothetical protein